MEQRMVAAVGDWWEIQATIEIWPSVFSSRPRRLLHTDCIKSSFFLCNGFIGVEWTETVTLFTFNEYSHSRLGKRNKTQHHQVVQSKWKNHSVYSLNKKRRKKGKEWMKEILHSKKRGSFYRSLFILFHFTSHINNAYRSFQEKNQ